VSLSKPITFITKEYKFPKPTSFIKAFIGEEDALSNKKLDKGIYNIKAPNFKQDIGYIARGNKDITSKLEFIYNNRDIKTLYYKTLKAEGYRVKISKKRLT